jgi:hypothetical protein
MAKKVTAREMFEEFGFLYTEEEDIVKAEGYLDPETRLIVVFYDEYESYFVDVDNGKKLGWVNMALHKAIDQCTKERGWGNGSKRVSSRSN